MLDEIFDLEDLPEDRRGEDILLDGERNAEALGVGVGLDEVHVGEVNEAYELFEADGEELLEFGAGKGACRRREEEVFAVVATNSL